MVTLNVPNAASSINAMTDFGTGFTGEYLVTIITVVLGLTAAALGIRWFTRAGVKFLGKVFGGGKRRRRGRR